MMMRVDLYLLGNKDTKNLGQDFFVCFLDVVTVNSLMCAN